MNKIVKNSDYFVAWIMIHLGTSIGSFIITQIAAFGITWASVAAGMDLSFIQLITLAISYVSAVILSYILFRWIVAVRIVRKIETCGKMQTQKSSNHSLAIEKFVKNSDYFVSWSLILLGITIGTILFFVSIFSIAWLVFDAAVIDKTFENCIAASTGIDPKLIFFIVYCSVQVVLAILSYILFRWIVALRIVKKIESRGKVMAHELQQQVLEQKAESGTGLAVQDDVSYNMFNWKRYSVIVALVGWGSYFVFVLSAAALYAIFKYLKVSEATSSILIFTIAAIYTVLVNVLASVTIKKQGVNISSSTPLYVYLAAYLPAQLFEFGYFQYHEPKNKRFGIVSTIFSLIGCILLIVAFIIPIVSKLGLRI